MIAAGFMLVSFQSLAIQIPIERDDGTLKRLEGTPIPRAAYFVGKIGLVLLTALLQVAVLLLVARLGFGVPIPTGPSRWVTFTWISVLGIAAERCSASPSRRCPDPASRPARLSYP
jgi:ABC-2 type transport system permease protein